MSNLFISHSSRDNEAAAELKARLEEQGHRSVFLDLDPEKGIQAGVSWERTLYTKLRSCRAVVALCSDNYLASQWCFAEIALARMEGKELFALQIEPWGEDTRLPSILGEDQFIDLRTDREQGYQRLWNGFEVKGIVPEEHRAWVPGEPPYPGLRAFEESDAPIFFGRDTEVREGVELLNRVRRQGHPRMVMVLGSSGSGKSSLARAGILPRLRRDRESWLVVGPLRPGRLPGRELALALSQAFEEAGEARPWQEILHRLGLADEGSSADDEPTADGGPPDDGPSARERLLQALLAMERELGAGDERVARSVGLLKMYLDGSLEEPRPAASLDGNPLAALATELRLAWGTSQAKVVLLIDQFEELLGHEEAGSGHPANRFLSLLKEGIEGDDNPPLALGTMRSDFLGMLQRSGPLRGVGFKSLSVGPMSEKGMRQVVERPALLGQIDLEDELTHRLLRETGTPDALPLLAFTLRTMWERYHETRRFDLQGYEALGGLQGAIAQVADDTLEAALAQSEEGTAKDLRIAFLSLARPAAEGGGWARQPASWDEMPERVRPMIQRFIDQRLLLKRADGTVEVAHEALFRSWEKLRGWLNANAEGLHLLREIRVDAEKWEKAETGDEKESYLWRSGRLARALELRGRGVLRLSELDDSFVKASDDDEKRRLAEIEARRKAKLRWTQAVAAVVLTAALVSIGLFIWARKQEKEARLQALRARQALLISAARQLGNDPTLRGALLREIEAAEPASVPAWEALSQDSLQEPSAVASLIGGKAAAFSPDSRRVVTGSADGVARVWQADGSGEPILLRGHDGPILAVAFSPKSERIVTASEDTTARVWRADGGFLAELKGHKGKVLAAVFSPGGERIVTASEDGTARVWRADGTAIAPLEGHEGFVLGATFSPNGQLVATASMDRTARVWNADGSGEPIVLRGHEARVTSAEFSPNGRQLLTVSWDGKPRIWNADGSGKATIIDEPGLGTAAFDPDGKRLALTGASKTVQVQSLDGSGEKVVLEGHTEGIWTAFFSPDGKRVVSASWDTTARLWNADGSGDPVVLRGHRQVVRSAVFSPDGRLVVSNSDDGTSRVWEIEGSGEPIVLRGHEKPVREVVFSPDSRRVVTASLDGTARVWNVDGSGEPSLLKHGESVVSLAFSRDGRRILTASEDRTARVWNADGGERTRLVGHQLRVWSAAFDPDEERIVTASEDGTVRIWNADGSGDAIVLRGHEKHVWSAVFGPAGGIIVSVSDDGTARVWNADGSGEEAVLRGDGRRMRSAALSPDGRRIVTTSENGAVAIWNAGDSGPGGFEKLQPTELRKHAGRVRKVVFSSDGRRFVTVSQDGTARIWNADGSGDPIILKGHEKEVFKAAFSPDGRRVVTSSEDGTARMWNADGSNEPLVLRGHTNRVQSVAFSPDGRLVATVSKDGTARVWHPDDFLARLWKSTPICFPPEDRVRLLGQDPQAADDGLERCRRMIACLRDGGDEAFDDCYADFRRSQTEGD